MTSEERFERIEHVTAALVEERPKDREEYRQLWRDTQHQIVETNAAVARLADESRGAIARLADELRASDARAREAEQQLRDRVDAMVSGIGQLIKQLSQRPPQ